MYPSQQIIQRRQQAAALLEWVLDEQMEPRLAINRWPEMGEAIDPSLEIAYQALWHFEADEDQQKSELFYMDAQLELLKQMAGFLRQGHALPQYMHQLYSPDTRVRFFYGSTFWRDTLQELARGTHWFGRLWQTVWRLAPSPPSISPARR